MGKDKKHPPHTVAGGPKERHRRIPKAQFDPKAPMPTGFEAKPMMPRSKSKHHSYFEFVENTEKKKKLEFQVTTKATPPPGFEFVPIGNPALTKACKELSRDKDAMIFIVSNTKEIDPNHLSHHVHRTGHHIREAIVEEARATLEHNPRVAASNGQPEPLPPSQEEYTAQANAAILDLFPRIPHTDRQTIIVHAFNLSSINQRPKPVGLCTDITLSRRVQLAVLAHIRHTHTRYDDLLKETSWQNARKVVEALCLDILVKWRGDEETGRDQLDEILREVVVISDSESEEPDEEDEDTEASSLDDPPARIQGEDQNRPMAAPRPGNMFGQPDTSSGSLFQSVRAHAPPQQPGHHAGPPAPHRLTARKEQKGFKRYRAWEEAIRRNREHDRLPHPTVPVDAPAHHLSRPGYESMANEPLSAYVTGGAGTAPEPNGYVPPRPYSRPSSLAPMPNPAVARPTRNLVTSDFIEQRRTPPGRSRYASPMADRLQDMLVRSVESASPDAMQPSFVRAVPPRRHLSPGRRPASYHPRSASPAGDVEAMDRPFYVERSVATDRAPGDAAPLRRPGDPAWHQSSMWSAGPSRAVDPNEIHGRQLAMHPSAPAGRVTVRPGHSSARADPILMEDRGGFFERVYEPAEAFYPGASNTAMGQAPRDTGRRPEPLRATVLDRGPRVFQHNVEVAPHAGARMPPQQVQQQPFRPLESYPVQRHPGPYMHGQTSDPSAMDYHYHRAQFTEPMAPRQEYVPPLGRPGPEAALHAPQPGSHWSYREDHPHEDRMEVDDYHGRGGRHPTGGSVIVID